MNREHLEKLASMGKIARVPTNLKQYRRALALLMPAEERGRTAAGAALLHDRRNGGPEGMLRTLRSRFFGGSTKRKGEPDVNAAHGAGTYWVRGTSDGNWFAHPHSEGVVTRNTGVTLRDNAAATAASGQAMGDKHALSGDQYVMRPKDLAVIDVAGRHERALSAAPADRAGLLDTLRETLAQTRPTKTEDGLNAAEWAAKAQSFDRGPEARAIRRNPRMSGEEHRDAIDALKERALGEAPRAGVRTADSRVFNLAMQDAASTAIAGTSPQHATNALLKEMYKRDLKNRLALGIRRKPWVGGEGK